MGKDSHGDNDELSAFPPALGPERGHGTMILAHVEVSQGFWGRFLLSDRKEEGHTSSLAFGILATTAFFLSLVTDAQSHGHHHTTMKICVRIPTFRLNTLMSSTAAPCFQTLVPGDDFKRLCHLTTCSPIFILG